MGVLEAYRELAGEETEYERGLRLLQAAVFARGDAGGFAVPVLDRSVRMAPGHVRRHELEGLTLGTREAPGVHLHVDTEETVDERQVLRSWWSRLWRTEVFVVQHGRPRRQAWRRTAAGGWRRATLAADDDFRVELVFVRWNYYVEPLHRWKMWLDTCDAGTQAWSVEAELRAQESLARYVTEAQYRSYLLTGTLPEPSRRSQAVYVLRRSHPTVVLLPTRSGDYRPSCTLCLHPVAYYDRTFAGGLCPTDDVIAHLLLLRADEHRFWRQANQHPIHARESGI